MLGQRLQEQEIRGMGMGRGFNLPQENWLRHSLRGHPGMSKTTSLAQRGRAGLAARRKTHAYTTGY